jgi:hypothetical protein
MRIEPGFIQNLIDALIKGCAAVLGRSLVAIQIVDCLNLCLRFPIAMRVL